jgi:hypothetical protein
MPEQVRYRTKLTQSGIFLVRYRTKIRLAGMPMPALVSSMPMPSYAAQAVDDSRLLDSPLRVHCITKTELTTKQLKNCTYLKLCHAVVGKLLFKSSGIKLLPLLVKETRYL